MLLYCGVNVCCIVVCVLQYGVSVCCIVVCVSRSDGHEAGCIGRAGDQPSADLPATGHGHGRVSRGGGGHRPFVLARPLWPALPAPGTSCD